MNSANKNVKIRCGILLAMAIGLCVFALAAPYFLPNDPNLVDLMLVKQPPSRAYPFGTDWLGRCVYSRVMVGASNSIFISLTIVGITLLFGSVIGMVSGYFGGIVDTICMRIVDIFLAFPGMVLAIAIAGMLGMGTKNAIIALSVTGWTQYARLTRGYVLSLRKESYISAAKMNGIHPMVILFKHVLPSAVRPVIVTAALSVGSTILGLAGLSFLGLSSSSAEWGSMLSEGRSLMQQAPWLLFYPAAAIFITSVIFNLLGDSIRDVLDPMGSVAAFGRKKSK